MFDHAGVLTSAQVDDLLNWVKTIDPTIADEPTVARTTITLEGGTGTDAVRILQVALVAFRHEAGRHEIAVRDVLPQHQEHERQAAADATRRAELCAHASIHEEKE